MVELSGSHIRLVNVRKEEISIEAAQVERQVADPMRAVYERKHIVLSADMRQAPIRDA